ncbi:MAG: phage tail protein [Proteobacteria bacterium]|nr:phage tail protein [Pseudomonadota bacterium]
MGFWSYFRDELRWPLIWKPGPISALVEGLARTMDDARADVLWFRNQFNPATCDDANLAEHAASRGLERHRLETDLGHRARCEKAFAWQALGGGQVGVPKILEHLGYPNSAIRNIREEDEERWAEFKVRTRVPERGIESVDLELIAWAANDQKPARSILAGLETEGVIGGGAYAATVLLTGTVVTLGPEIPAETNVIAQLYVGSYIHGISTTTLGE